MFHVARSPLKFLQNPDQILGRLLVFLILAGILFRGYGLGDRVYWVDEVATSVRIAGYTRAEVTAQLSDGVPRTPADLQQFLHPAPDLPLTQVLRALVQSPEHAPLYFLLAHGWTKLWGSSIVAVRSLSVLFSLISLALIGRLASQLFNSAPAGAIATTLLALSPFFVSYAQEARPYSLWSVTLLWSSLALWNAMGYATENVKQNVFGNEMPHSLWRWLPYGFSMAVGLYTSLLTALVLLGHGLYVLWVGNRAQRHGFLQAAALAVGLFLPWILIVLSQWDTLQANTEWMRQPMGVLPLLAIWLYNTSILLFDVPATLSPDLPTVAKLLTSMLLVLLLAIALRHLIRRTPRPVWGFVVLFALTIPTLLLGLDFLRNSQLSTAARYLLPFHLGMILVLSFYLTDLLRAQSPSRQRLGRGLMLCLVALCFLSYGFQLQQPPKYQKSRNLHNRAIAALINQTADQTIAPRLIAEPAQAMDLVSLSLDLQPQTQIQVIASMGENWRGDRLLLEPCQPVFLLNPSAALITRIQTETNQPVQETYRPQKLVPNELALSLWKVNQSCSFP
ncbi:glycosyltransferase family 39 protein [Thermoleptolyngbya sp. C42_A2020_037]|uniref:glycosyltransferase family 39 protein n=1 Tax=Thermoleptolyngbya sp. C42_A2020_037 TaxID=2747799 RepID=UPI0019E74A55|nr:glycosyltransferase family 39 protein [Thermoleptolyngbya sp. C42_A2020_037]MBF2084363.1 glycosyltransferase family 39 protein [Thermoleptolyngbya sp. C42_A2020_037]